MIVVDASAVLELLLRTPAAPRVAAAMFEPGRTVHAPHLVDVEVAYVCRRLTSTGEIDAPRGNTMLDLLRDMPIERHAHTHLLPRIWQLRANVTAYDASYVALAEMLGAPLLTRDGRLAKAVGHLVEVEVI